MRSPTDTSKVLIPQAHSQSMLQVLAGPDRDSGIATEAESDVDNNKAPAIKAYPFSDDDDHEPKVSGNVAPWTPPVFKSNSYYVNQADQAVVAVKQLVKDDGWKKALKHKSGVVVYMLQKSSKAKSAVFKGETVIQGFSPQSVFYVVGMRKLWDEQFDQGHLIENLNETTSLTYESYYPVNSSRAYDVTVVEKIDCSSDGVIVFACTSVETSQAPPVPGKSRHHIKLQGWILKPLHTNPPSTKVTFITEERVKGWIPGFTKKSLARRPLVIAAIDAYLQRKAERLRTQMKETSDASHRRPSYASSTLRKRPSILSSSPPSRPSPFSNSHPAQSSPTLGPSARRARLSPQSILNHPPPPRLSSLQAAGTTTTRPPSSERHIKFAEAEKSSSLTASPSIPSSSLTPSETLDDKKSNGATTESSTSHRLYPPSRHRSVRKQCMETLKRLASSDLDEWKQHGERNNTQLYSKSVQGSALPILRADGMIGNAWSAEQVCSVVQSFGARKVWDEFFESGEIVERFSQKEYLMHTQMKSVFPIHTRDFALLTTIESDAISGTIHVASTSVSDNLVLETKTNIRGRMLIYGWVLQPEKNDMGKLLGIKTTFICHMDLGGDMPLPPAIIRLLTTEVPACLDHVQWYLRQHGCPPYIRRVAGKVREEIFDSKTKTYRITYTAKHEPSRQHQTNRLLWCTDIRTHASMYANGYHIVTRPSDGVRVELRADLMGIRVYTDKESLDGQRVEVQIIPNTECPPGQIAQFSCNEQPLKLPPGMVCAGSSGPQELEESDDFRIEKSQASESAQQTIHNLLPQALSEKYVQKDHSVLVISEELWFTGPQLSIMFLLMTICYYMGKLSCRC
ncbi:uncharacterized protein BYT42DRAFT_399572 [Radiomyces spectabilis]|uniref:uncharacterized protein n=1 Tax=Radiomyces spectabilis TaxID=64574 RepID=UPI00221F5BD6|nr:uncharacterized protein BYT42DRAFT_399572 [Radiomyces spectabilis]KAI8374311.1 hypothetical protein BYT42DRAFT_399572 [Radiomyces spectabilis]